MVAVAPRPASGGALLYVRRMRPPRHQSGGIALHEGSTLHKRASHGAKPPPQAWRTPGHGGRGRTAHEQCQGAAPSNWHEHYARAQHNSPNNNHAGSLRHKTLPAHPPSPHIRYKTRPARAARPTSGTKLSQQESHGPLPVQNSPSTPTLAAYPVQNSPRTPEIAQFGAFSACRESFIPFSPPRS